MPFAIEQQRELSHQLETVDQPAIAFPHRRIAFQHSKDVRVRHALGAPNNAAGKVLRNDVTLPVNLEKG